MWGFVSVLHVFVYDSYSKIRVLQKGFFPTEDILFECKDDTG